MATLFGMFPFLQKLFADGGYQGPEFSTALAKVRQWRGIFAYRTFTAGEGLVEPRERIGCPSQSEQADWGPRLREARNKVLTLHAIPNFYFSYELRRSGGADGGRAHYAALFHQRLHFT